MKAFPKLRQFQQQSGELMRKPSGGERASRVECGDPVIANHPVIAKSEGLKQSTVARPKGRGNLIEDGLLGHFIPRNDNVIRWGKSAGQRISLSDCYLIMDSETLPG